MLSGGLPLGPYGGRRDLMEQIAPAGPVYQAGTLSGNPLAVASGIATLGALDARLYQQLELTGRRIAAAIEAAAAAGDVPVTVNRVGSMLTPFFTGQPVRDYDSAKRADAAMFGRWFRRLLQKGIALPPSQFESSFVSTAHDEEALAFLETGLADSFAGLATSPVTA